ncbi:MAG: SUF system Fe-S cluster assembly protein [Herbaspirillum sp.]
MDDLENSVQNTGSQDTADPGHEQLRADLIETLRTIYDPEIPVNIYDLGLIYELGINDNNDVAIQMTLTAPGCPVAGTFPGEVEQRLSEVPGVGDVRVELVWEPQWDSEMLTDETKLELGML